MNAEELRSRTKKFALEMIRLFRALPKTEECRIIGRQLAALGYIGGGELSGGMPVTFPCGICGQDGNRG